MSNVKGRGQGVGRGRGQQKQNTTVRGRGARCAIGGQGRGQGNYNSRENNANANDSNGGNYGPMVPIDLEDAYLKTWVPTVVMYHRSFQCCKAYKCQYLWTPDEMEVPHNMLFRMWYNRWGSGIQK